jgi:hypothetical protein
MRAMTIIAKQVIFIALLYFLTLFKFAWADTQPAGTWLCDRDNPSQCQFQPSQQAKLTKAVWSSWGKPSWKIAEQNCSGSNQYGQSHDVDCSFINWFIAECKKPDIANKAYDACINGGLIVTNNESIVNAVYENWTGFEKCKNFFDSASGFKIKSANLPKKKYVLLEKTVGKFEELKEAVDKKFKISSNQLSSDAMDAYKVTADAKEVVETAAKIHAFLVMVEEVTLPNLVSILSVATTQGRMMRCATTTLSDKCADIPNGNDIQKALAFRDYMNGTDTITCLTAIEEIKKSF